MKPLFLCVLYTCLISNASAQETLELSMRLNPEGHRQYRNLENYLNQEIEERPQDALEVINLITQNETGDTTYGSSKGEMFRYSSAHDRRNIGLEFSANFQTNRSSYLFDPESDDPGSHFFLQLGWNVLQQGFFSKRRSARANDLLGEREDLLHQVIHKDELFKERYNFVGLLFNKSGIELLDKRRDVLAFLVSESKRRYLLKNGTDLNYLDCLRKLRETEASLQGLKNFNTQFEAVSVLDSVTGVDTRTFPIWSLEIDSLHREISHETFDDEIARLKLKAEEIQNPWYDNVTLKPYMRYYGPGRDPVYAPAGSGNFTAGVQLRIPFSRPMKSKSKYHRIKREETVKDGALQRENRYHEVLSLFQEYQFLERQYAGARVSRKIIESKVRKGKVHANFEKTFPSFDMATLYEALLEVDYELNDIKKRMYLRLLQINRYLRDVEINQFLKQKTHYDPLDQVAGFKGMQITEDLLINNETDFISSYLLKMDVDIIYVSCDLANNGQLVGRLSNILGSPLIKVTAKIDEQSLTVNDLSCTNQVNVYDVSTVRGSDLSFVSSSINGEGLICNPDQLSQLESISQNWDFMEVRVSDLGQINDVMRFGGIKNMRLRVSGKSFTSIFELDELLTDIKQKYRDVIIVMDDMSYLLELENSTF